MTPAEANPRLFTFRRCPYAIRARMALASAGIAYTSCEVDLKNKPAQLLEISPKGTVPVLVLACGRVLEQSLDIMHWALRQNDPDGLLAADADEQKRTDVLIAQNDGDFKQALDCYKYPGRYGCNQTLTSSIAGRVWRTTHWFRLSASSLARMKRISSAWMCRPCNVGWPP
jgi:glutathione S-transferase